MRTKSTKKRTDEEVRHLDLGELTESMVLGVSENGSSVYIHDFDDDIKALEFLEVMVAGFRSEVLSSLMRRSLN